MTTAHRMRIERDTHGVWSGAFGDFVLRTAYQPLFGVKQGRIGPVACEALLRITRDGHPVLAEAFFNALESADFDAIEPELCRMHIRNAAHIPPTERRLFLNLDPRIPETPQRFRQSLDCLGRELRQAGIPPADVVCEFTEIETASDATLTHFAYELRARGYIVAVDDYGARASRPERVAALVPDIVKFDGRLVKRLLSTSAGVAALRMMVSRFKADGIHCVLEGLETLRDVGLGESTGAAMLQGYALAEPRLAGPDFGGWISRYRPKPVARDAGPVDIRL